MLLRNFQTKGGFRFMAHSQAEAEQLAAGAPMAPMLSRPAERPAAADATLSAAEIYARRRVQAQGVSVEAPIEGESVYDRRARQVRAARAGAAPEGISGGRVGTAEYAAGVFASRSRARPGLTR